MGRVIDLNCISSDSKLYVYAGDLFIKEDNVIGVVHDYLELINYNFSRNATVCELCVFKDDICEGIVCSGVIIVDEQLDNILRNGSHNSIGIDTDNILDSKVSGHDIKSKICNSDVCPFYNLTCNNDSMLSDYNPSCILYRILEKPSNKPHRP